MGECLAVMVYLYSTGFYFKMTSHLADCTLRLYAHVFHFPNEIGTGGELVDRVAQCWKPHENVCIWLKVKSTQICFGQISHHPQRHLEPNAWTQFDF